MPEGIGKPVCISLPPTTNFSCVIVGGTTNGEFDKQILEGFSTNIYGLNKTLTEWSHLGKIREGSRFNVALPLS